MQKEYLVKGPVKADLIAAYIETLAKMKDCGGHATFMGQVRSDIMDGNMVKAIEYSAYDEMVTKEAERIISVTKEAFSDVQNIVILHAIGEVKSGELSLFVMVAAGHRDQAFRACRHIVEMIKIDYPVWKKEIFEDDSHHWKENEK